MVVVMEELRRKISDAFQQMSNEKVINKEVLYECLSKIFQALYMSDIKYEVVLDLQSNVMKNLNLDDFAKVSHHEKLEIVRKALFNELCKLLDPGEPSFTPKKGETSVVMFVGLQGSGKTMSCIKYAYYHFMKGWKPALVGADIFTTGAFDQWKNNATDAKIPFHGSYLESDPVKIAMEGVERFKKENCDLIIVDTSGRHKLEAELLEEICEVYKETKPDLVIFSVDSSLGKAAFDETRAFMRSVAVGAVIVTKMDGHAKGGGALSVAAATKCPVTFIGTGKCMDEFEVFDVKPFVSRLIGTGDSPSGSMDKINEVGTRSQQSELLQKLSKGQFTLRIMYEICQNLLNWSKYQQVLQLLPGFCQELIPNDSEIESMAKIKCFITMMDLLTNKELDSSKPKLVKNSRIKQIAIGCGCEVREVMELLEVFNRLAKIWSSMKWLRFPGKAEAKTLVSMLGGKSGERNIKTKSRSYGNATVQLRI